MLCFLHVARLKQVHPSGHPRDILAIPLSTLFFNLPPSGAIINEKNIHWYVLFKKFPADPKGPTEVVMKIVFN
jgi:hypothetical protein